MGRTTSESRVSSIASGPWTSITLERSRVINCCRVLNLLGRPYLARIWTSCWQTPAMRADDHADATFHALNLHHEAELDSALFTGGEKEPAVVNKEAFRRRVKRLASRRCSVKKDRFPIVPKEAPAECEESRAVDIFTYPQERVPRRISGLRSF